MNRNDLKENNVDELLSMFDEIHIEPLRYNMNTPYIVKIQAWWRGCNMRNTKMLEPCSVKEIKLNISNLISYLKTDYLTPGRREYIRSTSTHNIQLEDGFMEYIVAKCIEGKRVGEGHCPIDIIKDKNGIDVLCVCINKKTSNEKSMIQNFKNCGHSLDQLFEQNKYGTAVNLYKKEYYNKLCDVKKAYGVEQLFYLGFISTDTSVYLTTLKIDLRSILNAKVNGVTPAGKSIKIINFIDSKYGSTILYKSKKRLELRFNRALIYHPYTIKIYSLDDTV